jgi:hypothetical protein
MTSRFLTPSFRFEAAGWRRSLFVGGVAFVIALASFLQAASSRGILSASPVNGGDEDGYERLGYNLAAGLGFGYCPTDMPIVSGAAEPIPTFSCEAGCEPSEFQPTAYRPPGFPLMIAAVYRFSPLNYFAVRVINCVCFALAVALAAFFMSREFSWPAGMLTAALCSIDPRMREFAGSFLTENAATLLLTTLAIAMATLQRKPTVGPAIATGLALSGLVLIRSFYVAWYPFLWLAIAARFVLHYRKTQPGVRGALKPWTLFCLASLLLTGPWWIRNCMILDAFMPAGTQGGIGIADGFSDSAYENLGSWTSVTADRIAQEMRRKPEFASLTALEFEREHSRLAAASASTWFWQNLTRVPRLSWWKLSRLWEFGSLLHGVLFGAMCVGLFATRSHPFSRTLFFFLILNSLTVMATYHTYERFMTPFRPMIHSMVACSACWIAQRLWRQSLLKSPHVIPAQRDHFH